MATYGPLSIIYNCSAYAITIYTSEHYLIYIIGVCPQAGQLLIKLLWVKKKLMWKMLYEDNMQFNIESKAKLCTWDAVCEE